MTTYRIILPSKDFPEFYQGAIKEYTKRLSRYCHIDIQYQDKNQSLLSLIEGYYSFKVTSRGKSYDSVDFSNHLQNLGVQGNSKIAFVINSKASSLNDSIALTTLDLSHGLELTCLLEQLYRSYKIIQNEPYHK